MSWPFYTAYHDPAYILRHDCSKNVTLRELHESRVYRLYNPRGLEVVFYKIDGGIIDSNEVNKCDYGILTENNDFFLVELKGADINHAIDQINSTIDLLFKRDKKIVKTLSARIVLSKVKIPNIIETKERKLKQLLHNNYGRGTYCRKTQLLEETI